MADTTAYPAGLDGDLRALVPAGTTPASFEDFLQLLGSAVAAIEAELGLTPSGAFASVKARSDSHEAKVAAATVGHVVQAAHQADPAALAGTVVAAADAPNTSTDVTTADAPNTSTDVAAANGANVAVADAPAQTAAYVQADVEAIRALSNANKAALAVLVTLSNEEKADFNLLRADYLATRTLVNEAKADLNALRADYLATRTLANEAKGDLNALRADVDALRTWGLALRNKLAVADGPMAP